MLKAPTLIIMGPPGSGKTYSIITLLESGLEVFDLITEPNGLDSILDVIMSRPNSTELLSRFHYHIVSPAAEGWAAMTAKAKVVGNLSFQDLAKQSDKAKSPDALLRLLAACNDFPDDRTGKRFGDVATWDDSRALVIDSLSGINRIARATAVGSKATPAIGEWGVMINLEDEFIFKLCADVNCYLVVLAHVNKFADNITGLTQISPRAITNSLGNDLGKNFSEVILARREKDKFFWSTSETMADVKNRAYPISSDLAPSFALAVAAHKSRAAALSNPPSSPGASST